MTPTIDIDRKIGHRDKPDWLSRSSFSHDKYESCSTIEQISRGDRQLTNLNAFRFREGALIGQFTTDSI